ncbi:hypothetical protein PAL_GLEAN10009720 [Pteropus alecto]|uniref:Uncharacterized protein n=1 Tax=Pteropus alecto TaxID=9402 RepID=L5KRX3_PTEAL|nr:hypothetical protein PAL_GLEAN10009720 [Pteropus alecto]
MDPTGTLDTEDELGPLAHLAPSPQSEAVAYELQELSLQSSQYLPPLNERKNVNPYCGPPSLAALTVGRKCDLLEVRTPSPLLTRSVSSGKPQKLSVSQELSVTSIGGCQPMCPSLAALLHSIVCSYISLSLLPVMFFGQQKEKKENNFHLS